ncbi:LysR substrate-binding domain-containing protein [Paenalcaligenes sp. Me131]|uniref:LysR substrate-binding domain-containing protein n=1 Tax=Paenalcaligenes sp. Me131 TaxID=3392636 RepID=UPI003D2B26E5
MELRQLRYFIGVCETGSLLRASARLHIAQPALGQQIAALENELGVKLFERSNRGMIQTDAGRIFLEHARVVLADAERAKQAVRFSSTTPSGEVAIGLPTSIALSTTLPILSACRQQFPNVRLKIVEAYSGFIQEWLHSGRLDIALLFGAEPEPGLSKRVLLDDSLVFVSSTQQPLADNLSLADISNLPLVLPGQEHGLRRIIDDACATQKLTLDVVAEIESLGSVKRATQAGLGSTILPQVCILEEVANGTLHSAHIDGGNLSRRVVCATSLTRPGSTAIAAVEALILDVISQMVSSGIWPARWIGEAL